MKEKQEGEEGRRSACRQARENNTNVLFDWWKAQECATKTKHKNSGRGFERSCTTDKSIWPSRDVHTFQNWQLVQKKKARASEKKKNKEEREKHRRAMGGGGLRILPHKSWNVYNYKNREKVRQDEEKAQREEEERQRRSRQAVRERQTETERQREREHAIAHFCLLPFLSLPLPSSTRNKNHGCPCCASEQSAAHPKMCRKHSRNRCRT